MRFEYFLTVLIALTLECEAETAAKDLNVTGVIDSLLVNYDKRIRPGFGGDPVDVGVTMYVISFSSLSDVDMDFTMHVYLRQFWTDPRLAFEAKPGLEQLSFGNDMGHEIWLPDTFIVNEKESFKHIVTVKNEFIRIKSDGSVARSSKYTITASCDMNFKNFPFDTQHCNVVLESYGHTATDIKYHWRDGDNSFQTSTNSNLGMFELVSHDEAVKLIRLSSGTYSSLIAKIEFKRLNGFYIQQIFIPCMMLVTMSWLSFHLKKRAYNLRILICGLSVLLMVIGAINLANYTPKTAYIKAIDIYVGVCLTFVFVAMLAFAHISNCPIEEKRFDDESTAKLDRFFRVAFPIAFGVFNTVYYFSY